MTNNNLPPHHSVKNMIFRKNNKKLKPSTSKNISKDLWCEGLPIHVAIIPDGNRRWALEQKVDPWEGHEAGAKNTEEIIKKASDLGIKQLSIWGSSINNLEKRPINEKRALLDIYERYFSKLINGEDIHKNETRISVIGRWEEYFPESLKKIFKEGIEKTKNYKKRFINIFLAYNGDDDMLEAVKKIAKKYDSADKVTAETIKENLMTKDLPPVDLLIRTGGDPHLSVGFMMWDIANAQLYFSKKFYPDFNGDEFEKAIREYQNRKRRMGK